MKKTIFFFVKVFKEYKYAEALLNGDIYMNTLSYFRSIEDGLVQRGDKYEAPIGWFQPDKIKLEINNLEINSDDLASPILIQSNSDGKINLYCMYCSHNGSFDGISEDKLEEFLNQIRINVKNKELGEYAVLIGNTKEFLSRVSKSVMEHDYSLSARLVEYYDPQKFNGRIDESKKIFMKRNEFEYQNEYRIAINTHDSDESPLLINIGSIKDIATLTTIDHINRNIEIKLPIEN